MYFGIYGLRKKWLDEFLKSPVPDRTLTSNIVSGAKHTFNLDGSTYTIFIDHG